MSFNNASAALVDGAPTAWYAVDHGLGVWAFDPRDAGATFTLASAGVMYGSAVKSVGRVITNIVVNLTTAGATLTAGQNFAAVYGPTGALLGQTADVTTQFGGSTGVLTLPLTAPVTATEGVLSVVVVANGTTKPTFAVQTVSTVASSGLATPNLRFFSAGSSITTTLPATMPAQTAITSALWAALS